MDAWRPQRRLLLLPFGAIRFNRSDDYRSRPYGSPNYQEPLLRPGIERGRRRILERVPAVYGREGDAFFCLSDRRSRRLVKDLSKAAAEFWNLFSKRVIPFSA